MPASDARPKPYASFFSEAFEETCMSSKLCGLTHFTFVLGLKLFGCWIWGISCFGVLDIDAGGGDSLS